MSVLTHAVLITDHEIGSAPMTALRAWCLKHAEKQQFEALYDPDRRRHEDWPQPGGAKVFCESVYAACFNYLPQGKLLEAFPGFGWQTAEHMAEGSLLVLRGESDDEWTAVHGNGAPARQRVMPAATKDVLLRALYCEVLRWRIAAGAVGGQQEVTIRLLAGDLTKILHAYDSSKGAIQYSESLEDYTDDGEDGEDG